MWFSFSQCVFCCVDLATTSSQPKPSAVASTVPSPNGPSYEGASEVNPSPQHPPQKKRLARVPVQKDLSKYSYI
jgi:hypothetical protein